MGVRVDEKEDEVEVDDDLLTCFNDPRRRRNVKKMKKTAEECRERETSVCCGESKRERAGLKNKGENRFQGKIKQGQK